MFKLVGVDKFIAGIEQWKKEVQEEAQQVHRGIAVEAFYHMLYETPQWTGSAVANWNFSVGSPNDSVDTSLKREFEDLVWDAEPFQKNHPRAIARAVQNNAGKDEILEGFPSYFLSNAAENLDGESYIDMLETNPNGFLRSVNDPGHMVENYKSVFSMKSQLSVDEVKFLKKRRIGSSTSGYV